jgi:SEC-C motif-containing protein
MRARYSAFATGAVDYLLSSHHSRTRHLVKRREIETWSRSSEWIGLDVLATSGGGDADQRGTVSFRAHYRTRKETVAHAEKAEFEREDGQWRFVDGTPITHAPVRRAEPKVGRNDPCPCGSGKKFKKCCGASA